MHWETKNITRLICGGLELNLHYHAGYDCVMKIQKGKLSLIFWKQQTVLSYWEQIFKHLGKTFLCMLPITYVKCIFFLSFQNCCFSKDKKYLIVRNERPPKKRGPKLEVEEKVSTEFHFQCIKVYKAAKFF